MWGSLRLAPVMVHLSPAIIYYCTLCAIYSNTSLILYHVKCIRECRRKVNCVRPPLGVWMHSRDVTPRIHMCEIKLTVTHDDSAIIVVYTVLQSKLESKTYDISCPNLQL